MWDTLGASSAGFCSPGPVGTPPPSLHLTWMEESQAVVRYSWGHQRVSALGGTGGSVL